MVTVALAGAGSRGRTCYAQFIQKHPDKVKLVAVADIIDARVNEAAATFDIPAENCFKSANDMLQQDKLADIMFICTPDENHHETAIKALKKGYHLLLEKPAATTDAHCIEIARVAKECNRHVVVCHVLRYSPFYGIIKDVISSGKIGEVVTINAFEGVGYWHQAHSYVRGNWRDASTSTPMILAKCCHDIDILVWLMDTTVRSVSSYGNLFYFNEKNAPEGATSHCLGGCKVKENCPYDAEKIYLTGNTSWPVDVVAKPTTKENVRNALIDGPYGRCVFKCDNNVVDHQVVNMQFEGGKTAHLTMSGFTSDIYRTIQVMGTLGMIEGDMRTNIVTTTVFGQPAQQEDMSRLISGLSGHGGGDERMFNILIELAGGSEKTLLTSIDNSIESHLICFAAERSRLNGGIPEVL